MSILSTAPVSLPNLYVGYPIHSPTFSTLIAPLEAILPTITPLESSGNREIKFGLRKVSEALTPREYQMKSLIYYHTEEFTSAQALLQAMREDEFVHHTLVPEEGLGESTFYEANATRGAIQMLEIFDRLSKKATKHLSLTHAELGELVAIDGSLIDASLSMTWADYTSFSNKAKVHQTDVAGSPMPMGLDLNTGIPRKLYLTEGKAAERPFVSYILEVGQTGVVDRGYQDHNRFDEWIDEEKHFVARPRC